MSERRACHSSRRSVQHPVSGKTTGRCTVESRLRQLAQQRRRFGYRRLHVLLKREGCEVNRKRIQRLYVEEKLQVPRGGRKRALGTRVPMAVPDRPNARWSLDFAHDQMTDGRRFRILAVVDDCTRECLALVPDTSISGMRVAASLTSSPPVEGGRHRSSRTMAPSSPRTRYSAGPTSAVWRGITSSRASRFRTPSRKASSGGCGMSFSMRPCSAPSRTPAASSRPGGRTTIPHHNTHLSMPLKRIDFADRTDVLRGVWPCGGRVRRGREPRVRRAWLD